MDAGALDALFPSLHLIGDPICIFHLLSLPLSALVSRKHPYASIRRLNLSLLPTSHLVLSLA